MFGEEVIIKRIIDELDKKYRGERDRLEDAKRTLNEIKLSLLKVTLHRRICSFGDERDLKKLSSYMQDDIDRLHTLVFKARIVAGTGLFKDLTSFIEKVLEYNEMINSQTKEDEGIPTLERAIDDEILRLSRRIDLRIRKLEEPFLKKKQKEIQKMIPEELQLLEKVEEIQIFGGKEKESGSSAVKSVEES